MHENAKSGHLINYYFLSFSLKGFDNNGAKTGPRSTRQSNPEDHASNYFNTFSKDMLVQVGFVHFKLITNTVSKYKNVFLCLKLALKKANHAKIGGVLLWGMCGWGWPYIWQIMIHPSSLILLFPHLAFPLGVWIYVLLPSARVPGSISSEKSSLYPQTLVLSVYPGAPGMWYDLVLKGFEQGAQRATRRGSFVSESIFVVLLFLLFCHLFWDSF